MVFGPLVERVWDGPLGRFITLLVVIGFLASLLQILFRNRKIQPHGFRWKAVGKEIGFAAINTTFTGFLIASLSTLLTGHHLVRINPSPAPWYIDLAEYVLAFALLDTWVYWWHRLMHVEPLYTWVHKVHHFSTSPNLLTAYSFSPIEATISGAFSVILPMAIPLHQHTMSLLAVTILFMTLYAHCGFEFMPRWWCRTWFTKWLITATFHDQHHRYFRGNYSGYTTFWDRVCGTMRPRYEIEFGTTRPIPKAIVGAAQIL